MVMTGVGDISIMLPFIMVIALVMVKPREVIGIKAGTTQSGMD